MSRILSGMRPTGKMHLGNYSGPLVNWIRMQDEHDCLFMVADWHMLTTAHDRTEDLETNTREMVIDWLAAGISPERATVFIQSQVPEHAELHLLLSMLAPLSWLTRSPSLKEMVRNSDKKANLSYGLVGYPVLQTADILMYRGDRVPVGEDQVPHLEMARELCRRFNQLYGEVFPEPQAILSRFPRLPGLDGKRMSKSAGNHISLSASPDELQARLKLMITDPQKVRRGDPGRPDICAVHSIREAFGLEPESVISGCRSGELGCVACKTDLASRLCLFLEPFRERRQEITDRPGYVADVLAEGQRRAGTIAGETMGDVRRAMHLDYRLRP